MRMLNISVCAAILLAFGCGAATARSHGGRHGHSGYRASSYHVSSYHKSRRPSRRYRSYVYRSHPFYSRHPNANPAFGVPRDEHGRIARSESAKRSFRRRHPCPSTGRTTGRCPGYVIDHVRALKHGGMDDPSNMQWQTTEAAKAKDRTE